MHEFDLTARVLVACLATTLGRGAGLRGGLGRWGTPRAGQQRRFSLSRARARLTRLGRSAELKPRPQKRSPARAWASAPLQLPFSATDSYGFLDDDTTGKYFSMIAAGAPDGVSNCQRIFNAKGSFGQTDGRSQSRPTLERPRPCGLRRS
jgi:hypothetical protein